MISEQGVVKVMDFGIARAIDDSAATMTQSQGVVGTCLLYTSHVEAATLLDGNTITIGRTRILYWASSQEQE